MSFFRIIKTGFVNFWRNSWLSAAATIVTTVTLIILAVLFLLFALTNSSIKSIRNTVDISVYFKIGLSEDQIMSIKQELQADPKVKEVDYTSADQALAEFKQEHANDPDLISSLNELNDNPLPATLHIKAQSLDDYPAIAQELAAPQYTNFITKVNFEDNRVIIDRLNRILKFIVTFGTGLIVVFCLIALLVIYNTITLTIYNRKEELEIMRLVGATNWYIRGPFLVESLLYSIFGTIITGLLLIPIFTQALPRIFIYVGAASAVTAPGLANVLFRTYLPFISNYSLNYVELVIMLFIISLIISTASTFWAIRKYLKI